MAGVLLLLFLTISLSKSQLLRVYVDGVEGCDSPQCLTANSSETACQSLSFVAERLTSKNTVYIEIIGSVLNLTRPINFNKYSNLTIIGSQQHSKIYCNTSGAGIAFIEVNNLSIYSLSIEKCGVPRASTSIKNNTIVFLPVSVYVLNCTNVVLEDVNIMLSNGTGLSMYDTNGSVNITHCNFINNKITATDSTGGGGVYIEFTSCTPGTMDNCFNNNRNNGSRYIIEYCNFTNNSAYCPDPKHGYVSPSEREFIPRLGKGGGLYISIGLNATNNTFLVGFCNFTDNQASNNAGGMVAEFLNSVKNNTVSVTNTQFIRNNCTQTEFSAAGGLIVAFMLYSFKLSDGQSNAFYCLNCTFHQNIGHMGGGVAIFSAKAATTSMLSKISFINCNWMENSASMGAGVIILPGIWDQSKEGYLPVPTFTNCSFISNYALQTHMPHKTRKNRVIVETVGYGALFSNQYRVLFRGRAVFNSSTGSAVHLSNSVLEFESKSDVIFYNNTSHDGGAIAMYGSSTIRINHSSSFLFTGNRAVSRGGGIFFDFHAGTRPAYHNCFISPSEFHHVNTTFIFRENIADASGTSIFATTFQMCKTLCSGNEVSSSPEDIMRCITNFTFDDTNSPLSTRPDDFKVADPLPLALIPGSEFTLDISVTDEAKQNLSGVVYEASATGDNITIDPAFLQVSNDIIKVLGETGSKGKLQLYTFDTMVSFDISLTDCQPGYLYIPSSRRCECGSSRYPGLEGCDPKVYLKQGYWMGHCSQNSSELCTTNCPIGYCSYTHMNQTAKLHVLPNSTDSLNDGICGPKRNQRLCGECSPGYSLHYNSFQYTCDTEKLCSAGWAFFILSVIIPLTLLFIIVLVFNVSFTNGNANCFVLYGQVLCTLSFQANESFQLPYTVQFIQKAVTFPYDYFNMNFFTFESLSYCLWKGASFLNFMMIKYLTVGYALLLVLITIFITRYSSIHRRIFYRFEHRCSVLIHGLSAFFILCYSQASRTTFHIISYTCLSSNDDMCVEKVVFRAGHLTYFGKEHFPYATVAIFFLLFMILAPPILLLAYPLIFKLCEICRLSGTKFTHILWRLMPIQFLDAFQSTFKDRYRFFAGLYFLYRAAFLALFVCTISSWLAFYCVVQFLLTFILTLHSVLQPHKCKKHNVIDSLLFANLCIINAITLYGYGKTEVSGQLRSGVEISALAIVQAVLIIMPLLSVVTVYVVEWIMSCRKRKDYSPLPPLRIN